MKWHDISDTARGCVVYTERTEMAADFQYIVSGCITTVVLMSVCLEQTQCCKELLNGITAQRSKAAFSCCFILIRLEPSAGVP